MCCVSVDGDKTVRDVFWKMSNVSSTQLALHAEMGGLGVSSASILPLSAFCPQLLVWVIFSRRFSRKPPKVFRPQKHLRNGWIWRMNKKVLSMELGKFWTQPVVVKMTQGLLSRMDDKRLKTLNAQQANLGLTARTLFLGRTYGWISCFGFQLVYVLEPTSVLRIRASVVKELTRTVHTDYLHQECWSFLTTILSLTRRWDLSTWLQCSNREWTVPNWWRTPSRSYHDSLWNG